MSSLPLAADSASEAVRFNNRLLDLLDRTNYRQVVTDADREAIFRFRYEAYRRDEGVASRFDRRLSDRFDDLDNTYIYAMYIDGEMASTIRVSVINASMPDCPATAVFSDLLDEHLAAGKVLVDPTRHASNEKFAKLYPMMLPYLTIRVPWMIAEYFNADAILAGVRAEHRAFYRRTFGSRQLGEARLYPTLLKPHYLTYGEYRQVRDEVQQRYPSFRSSAFERRMLMEGGGAALASGAVDRQPVREQRNASASL